MKKQIAEKISKIHREVPRNEACEQCRRFFLHCLQDIEVDKKKYLQRYLDVTQDFINGEISCRHLTEQRHQCWKEIDGKKFGSKDRETLSLAIYCLSDFSEDSDLGDMLYFFIEKYLKIGKNITYIENVLNEYFL